MSDKAAPAHGAPLRPQPATSVETRPFWQAAREGVLRLPRCTPCATLYYPPPPRCPRCHASTLTWVDLSGRARVVGFTTSHLSTIAGVTAPFTLVEVEPVEQAGLVIGALLAASEPNDLVVGQMMQIAFTAPDARGVAYPQVRRPESARAAST